MFKDKRNTAFIAAVSAVIAITVIICICAFSFSGGSVEFESSYYFVCYRSPDNVVSAGSISSAVSSYGGAGYILDYDGKYYVTVSCYYRENDANTVCESLKRRDLECAVLTVKTDKYPVKSYSAKRNAKLYKGNFNTLNSLSLLAYECANGLDTGEYNQTKAKDVLAAIKNGLNGLKSTNKNNCFTDVLDSLIDECDDLKDGYLFSKDMRYLQIAIADKIINAELI
ncbi:MAG: hypothetical protein K2N22_03355 [Clostridia bacterium]|nr:hypothetical protein [Clostridia bacterium]